MLKCTTAKPDSALLNARLCNFFEGLLQLSKNWQGAWPRRRTNDNVLILHQIRESLHKANSQCIVVFLDFSKAFDRVNISLLYKVMRIIGIPEPFSAAVAALYKNWTVS